MQKDTEREEATEMMKGSKGTSSPLLLLQQSLAWSALRVPLDARLPLDKSM